MVWLLCTMWWCDCCVLCDGVTVVYCVMVCLLCTVWWCDSCVLCDGVTVVYSVVVRQLCTKLMVCLLCTLWRSVPVVYSLMVCLQCTHVMVWHSTSRLDWSVNSLRDDASNALTRPADETKLNDYRWTSAHSTMLTKTSPPSLSSLIISVLGQPLPSALASYTLTPHTVPRPHSYHSFTLVPPCTLHIVHHFHIRDCPHSKRAHRSW